MDDRRIEVWALPDDTAGFRVLFDLGYLEGTNWQDPDDTPGKGTVILPSGYEITDDAGAVLANLDSILRADPTDVPSCASTLIAVFDPGSETPTVPDFEFFAEERVDPIGPGQTSIGGPHISSALNDATVFPRALDDPVWLWGQKTVTKNSDLTEGTVADEEFEVWLIATAGTWRIDLGASGWSATIDAVTGDAADVKAAIEAGPSSVVEVNVTGLGTVSSPFLIHIVDPAATDYFVQVDDASLTGDIFVNLLTDGGDIRPTYYTPAQTIGGVLFGVMGEFEVVDDPFGGPGKALFVTGNSAYIGAQQILEGVLGLVGYADVEIGYVTGPASSPFRLGVRDIDEGWLYTVEQDITSGSWQTITIPYPMVLVHDQVILRAASIADNPPDFYIRFLNLYPGQPPAPWPQIVVDFMASFAARGVLDWVDTSAISTSLDHNGDAWVPATISYRGDPGMSMGRDVMAEGKELGYEYEIIRKAMPPGGYVVGNPTHDLRLFNRLGRGETPTVDPAVIIGDIDSGQLAKRRILMTHVLVEYSHPGKFVEVTHADFAAMPRREGFLLAEYALDEATAIQAGETYLLEQIDDILGTQIKSTSIEPYRHVRVGDQIPYELGSHADRHTRRIHTISTGFDGTKWSAEYTASHMFTTEMTAMKESIRRLQEALLRRERPAPRPITPIPPGCCPSCPAHAEPSLVISDSSDDITGGFDWEISDDKDGLLRLTAGNDLLLVKPGLYTIDLNIRMVVVFTAAGVGAIELHAGVDGNDAGNFNGSWPAVSNGAFGKTVLIHARYSGHTEAANKQLGFSWNVLRAGTYPTANLISNSSLPTLTPSGSGNFKELTVVRHSAGCAQERFCS